MTAFPVLAVLLLAGVIAAIAWPLWRSRDAGGDRAGSRPQVPAWAWIALAGAPALVVVAWVLLAEGGAAGRPVAAASSRDPPHGFDARKVAATADLLAARLRERPDDGEGWATLGRSLAALGRYAEAAEALGEALARLPATASLLADRADVLAMAQGRRFAGEPDRLVREALEADPRHVKALALAGSSAFDRGDHAVAATYWRRLLAVAPPGGPMAREVEARVREAERRANAASATAITGTVAFAAGHARALGPRDVVFVVAKPLDGRGRPVAVARIPATALPAAFRLDDGDSLVPAAPLSGQSEVILEAMIGPDGSAGPAPGAPRSAPRVVRSGERAVALELRTAAD